MMAIQAPRVVVLNVEDRKVPLGDGFKKGFIHLSITGLTEKNPIVELSPGQLGFGRIVHLAPSPLGEHFSVVWDGERTQPTLSFDGWTEGEVRVALEVTGR